MCETVSREKLQHMCMHTEPLKTEQNDRGDFEILHMPYNLTQTQECEWVFRGPRPRFL
jgi:hypothetical protein